MRSTTEQSIEFGRLSSALAATGRGAPSLEDKLRHIRLLRERGSDAGYDKKLDSFLLEEIARLSAGLKEAGKNQVELKKLYEGITSPPLHPALFLQHVPDGGRSRAMVGFQSTRRVVTISGECDPDSLEPGDEVLLANELNTIVSKLPHCPHRGGETARFERCTGEGQLVLKSHGDEEVIVSASAHLKSDDLKAGDMVRLDRSFWIALEKIERSRGNEFFLEETPVVTFDDIGGLEKEIEALKRSIVLHLEHVEIVEKYRLPKKGSFLFVGPPGTGKTMMAKALANWLAGLFPSGESLFVSVKPGSLHSMWFGQSEARYRELFRVCREAAERNPGRPVVLFLDEIEAICSGGRDRSVSRGVDEKVTRAFLAELDGLESRGNIVVGGATNRREILDDALIRSGRMGDNIIPVPRPNLRAARKIFGKYFEADIPYSHSGSPSPDGRRQVIESALSKIYSPNGGNDLCTLKLRDGTRRVVKAGDLISGASIKNIAMTAKERSCLRELETGRAGIELGDVLSAVAAELETLAANLAPVNCWRYIADLPQDVDVVSVEPIARKVSRPHRYLDVA